MESNRKQTLAALEQMSVAELRGQYAQVFGEATASHNRIWLLRRIAWRVQALAEGDLSERARRRIAELANDADLRLGPPRAVTTTPRANRNTSGNCNGYLLPGSLITRHYKGAPLEVKVVAHGFEYEGTIYRSLSAVAKAITGSHCSGYTFFNLRHRGAL